MSVVREVPTVTRPRQQPDWLHWLLSLGYFLVVLPAVLGAAVLQGCLSGEMDSEKWRLFGPDREKRR